MSEQHTPEPWEIKSKYSNIILISENPLGYAIVNGMDCFANARRIVACVNSCAGVPTLRLSEGRPIAETFVIFEKQIEQLKQSFEELQKAIINKNVFIEQLKKDKQEVLAELNEIKANLKAPLQLEMPFEKSVRSALKRTDQLIERMKG